MGDQFQNFLKSAYDTAIIGVPKIGISSAEALANKYRRDDNLLDKSVNSLIRFQTTKASTTGFLTGLGGVITLPVSVPADVSIVLFVQIRMIAAIAIMAGFDPHDDRVRTLCYTCLVGNSAQEILKDAGIIIGKKAAEVQLKRMSADILVRINKKVGFRLLTKFGEKGTVNLWKLIPLLGGVVGGSFDSAVTYSVGRVSKRIFVTNRV